MKWDKVIDFVSDESYMLRLERIYLIEGNIQWGHSSQLGFLCFVLLVADVYLTVSNRILL